MSFEFSTECEKMVVELLEADLSQRIQAGEMVDLADMELKIREGLHKIGRHCLAKTVSNQENKYLEDEVRCVCGQMAKYQRRREATAITVFGKIKYNRAYYHCKHCHQGQSPLDKRLGIQPGQISAGLGPLLALLGIETPFEKSSKKLVTELLLLRLSDNTIRKETELMGELQAQIEAEQARQSAEVNVVEEIAQAGGQFPQRLYGSMDGVHAPILHEWRELKSGLFYKVQPYQQKEARAEVGQQEHLKATPLHYFCALKPADEFGDLLWSQGYQQQAHLHQELVFVADGAPWIWNLVRSRFPQATQILDWYHAAEYLPPIAQAAFALEAKQTEWLQKQRQLLWDGEIDALILACETVAEEHPKAESVALTAANYFDTNKERMDYARFRREGYQIGSGPMESGCKQIVSLRLKQAGARWRVSGAEQTAKARAAWLSGNWGLLKERRRQLPLAA